MKKICKKIFIVMLLSSVLFSANSYAVSKLDFTEGPNDIMTKIQKVKERIEQKYTEIMEILNEKIRKVFGAEGAYLINEYVFKRGSRIVKNAIRGQLAVGDFSLKGLTQSMLSQLGEFKLDLANLAMLADDYARALQYGKLEKTRQMHIVLSQYEAERDAILEALKSSPGDEELKAKLEDLNINIANMEAQIRKVMTEQTEDDRRLQSYRSTLISLDAKIGSLSIMRASEELVKTLNSKLDNLFDKLTGVESPFATSMNKLFLGFLESPTSKNLRRIQKARKKEYYEALKNVTREYLNTYNDIERIAEESQSCVEALSKADGIAGQQTMQICVDIQQAKAAAGYTKLLLAKLRYRATSDLQFGSGNYSVNGYADPTIFNLDNYKFKKSDLYVPKIKDIKNAISQFKGF